MSDSLAAHATDIGGAEAWRSSHAAPRVALAPFTRPELEAWFRGGEPEADECERLLVWAARARGAIDLALAEGLDALRRADRLASLGYHLDDYAREVLDLGRSAAEKLARLGRELRTRPLLREALRSGRVRLRAAETILTIATGDAEARWVERASRLTVRALEAEVRRAGVDPAEEDEPWLRLRTQLPPDERSLLDAGLELAREVQPGASRIEGLEALAQEFLAEHPGDPDDDPRSLGGEFRAMGPGREPRRATLEAETERWAVLPVVPPLAAPEVRFDGHATAQEIDAALRGLAELRAGWDDLVGHCAYAVRQSRLHALLGFADFRHYCEERLELPPRTVEQRAALEKRLWASRALQEARRQRLPFEKLRLLSRLPEREIAAWTPRAHALTCIALRRALEGEEERQLRTARRLSVPLPRRIAALLAAAIEAVRRRAGEALGAGKCLAVIAWHFLETWLPAAKGGRSRSQRVRERDEGHCQVPGCSHRAAHAHHIAFRSRGGGDDPWNQVALCGFHHLRCVHGGHLRVSGRAPDGLVWLLAGQPWTGKP